MKVINGMYVSPEKRRTVPGYEGLYEVSDKGGVFRNGFQLEAIDGMYVNLSKNGRMEKVKVCYLVARAFIPNMEMRRFVRHKDGNPRNNCVENLYWDEEADYRNVPGSVNAEKAVLRIGADGVGVVCYRSIREAAEKEGVSRSAIQRCLAGKSKTCNGYIWRYSIGGKSDEA